MSRSILLTLAFFAILPLAGCVSSTVALAPEAPRSEREPRAEDALSRSVSQPYIEAQQTSRAARS